MNLQPWCPYYSSSKTLSPLVLDSVLYRTEGQWANLLLHVQTQVGRWVRLVSMVGQQQHKQSSSRFHTPRLTRPGPHSWHHCDSFQAAEDLLWSHNQVENLSASDRGKPHSLSPRRLVQWSNTAFQEDMIGFIFLKNLIQAKIISPNIYFYLQFLYLLTFSHGFMEYL